MNNKPMPSKLIVPLSGLTDRETQMSALVAEYKSHLAAAQDHYEKALDAERSGLSEAKQLRLTVIEQNAALLAQQEILMMLMGGVLTETVKLSKALAPPGGLAS